MKRAHIISRVAYGSLVALVIGFLAFAIGAAFVTKDAGRVEAEATTRSELFAAARYQVSAEQSLHDDYEYEPSAETLRLHARAANVLTQELHAVRAISDPTTAAAVDRLLALHAHYLRVTHLLFAAVDEHAPNRSREIDHQMVDPVSAAIQTKVNDETLVATKLARRAQGKLRATEDFVIALTLIVSFIAIIVLSAIHYILRNYQERVDATIRHEIDTLKAAALSDYLTGLGNHRAYQEDVHQLSENMEGPLTVALVDVDEFKTLNDREGHLAGDRVLTSLANLLRSSGAQSTPYRLGGDEFAMTFIGMSPLIARARLEQIRRVVEADLGGTTVSIGFATSSAVDSDLIVLRDQADSALYEAKRRGRNTVVSFDEIREEAALFMPGRIAQVRELIASGTIGVAFQPIWDSGRRSVLGYEALARQAGDDPINPQDAFDIAERIGKAHELDRVCRSAVLSRARLLPPQALLFINVSPQSLDHGEFRDNKLVEAVTAAGLRPDQVVLEITERSIARLPVVVREAKRLRSLGFALALDDAGSGNSGLEMLSQLAVDFVKIDREVIVRAQFDVGGRAVLAGIIAIAQEMHAQIIAEGIEDTAMLELVRNATRWSTIPCALQGYYLGRPQAEFVDAVQDATIVGRLSAFDEREIAQQRTA